MIPQEWSQLRPHPIQSALWRSNARFKAVVAGRGSGKTLLARRYIIRQLPVIKPWPDPIYFYALPTRDQAKRIAWKKLKALVPKEWKPEFNESELKITTKYGSTLYVFGMDKPQRAEGLQYDGGIIDESSDQKPTVFNLTFLPALSERKGFCWRIGVPKRFGVGAEDFKEFYNQGLKGLCIADDPSMRIESFHWLSEDIIDKSEIAFAKTKLDAKDYNEQYRANWETASGLVFHAYDDVLNVDDSIVWQRDRPIDIGSDFNVDPMAWVIGQRRDNNSFVVFDEIWLRNVSTQDALNYLYAKYSTQKSGWNFFGDASGRARKTAANSAAMSDYIQIANDSRFKGAKIHYPKANPSIVDRFASTNAMLCNAAGQRRLQIHPRCKMLRQDLGKRAYKQGTREPDDSGDIGHITDALGYVIHRIFPLRVGSTGIGQIGISSAQEKPDNPYIPVSSIIAVG